MLSLTCPASRYWCPRRESEMKDEFDRTKKTQSLLLASDFNYGIARVDWREFILNE